MRKHFRSSMLKVFFVSAGFFTALSQLFAAVSIENLKVEYSKTPIGIDIRQPRFSWQMTASGSERGQMQTAFEIVVKDPEGSVAWDSKKIIDGTSLGKVYSGSSLKAGTRYSWTVIVWDQSGKSYSNSSWFETGLMNFNPDLSAWEGAKWIGGGSGDLVL